MFSYGFYANDATRWSIRAREAKDKYCSGSGLEHPRVVSFGRKGERNKVNRHL
jgi:hypothetical protein